MLIYLRTLKEKYKAEFKANPLLYSNTEDFLVNQLVSEFPLAEFSKCSIQTREQLQHHLEKKIPLFKTQAFLKSATTQMSKYLTTNRSTQQIPSGVIDTIFTFTTYDEAIDLSMTGCGGDASKEQAAVAKAMQSNIQNRESSIALFTGDMVYPYISLTTKAEDIAHYFSPYNTLGAANNFAALGNHESGAITPLWGQDPAYGSQDQLLRDAIMLQE